MKYYVRMIKDMPDEEAKLLIESEWVEVKGFENLQPCLDYEPHPQTQYEDALNRLFYACSNVKGLPGHVKEIVSELKALAYDD